LIAAIVNFELALFPDSRKSSIQPGTPLDRLLLAEVAYGYGKVPILYQKSIDQPAHLMPSDDIRLEAGDRLVVLVTFETLHPS
jgi:hypothetical protein